MAIEIVVFPIKHGGSFHGKMLVHQRVIASRAGAFSGTWDHHRIIDSVVIYLIFQRYTLVTWDTQPICKITKTSSAHLWALPGGAQLGRKKNRNDHPKR